MTTDDRYAQVRPRDPSEVKCNWCDEPSNRAHAFLSASKKLKTGKFVYTCPAHHALGEQVVAPRERQPKA